MRFLDYVLVIVLVSACTFLVRAFPFIVFSGKREMPYWLRAISGILPASIMSILVVYCLRIVVLFAPMDQIALVLGTATVVGVHLWKRNTLLSMFMGTAVYMILLRM